MARAEYREASCRSALTRVRGMPFEWSLNPYRGCEHGCVYCYAREYHALMGRDVGSGFDREIEVKVNFVEVLRSELARARTPSLVALGTGTDPYQPCEGRYRLTRGTLEALLERPRPLIIITKSPLIVRDAALLAELTARTAGEVHVMVSIGILDEDRARSLEPTVAPPRQRLRAVSRLVASGVKAGVIAAPIVPGISDGEAAIETLCRASHEHGAHDFRHRLLKLDPAVKSHYLDYLRRRFPQLADRQEALYARGAHADRAYAGELDRTFARVRSRYRFPADAEETATPPAPAQLTLTLA